MSIVTQLFNSVQIPVINMLGYAGQANGKADVESLISCNSCRNLDYDMLCEEVKNV